MAELRVQIYWENEGKLCGEECGRGCVLVSDKGIYTLAFRTRSLQQQPQTVAVEELILAVNHDIIPLRC